MGAGAGSIHPPIHSSTHPFIHPSIPTAYDRLGRQIAVRDGFGGWRYGIAGAGEAAGPRSGYVQSFTIRDSG